MENSIVRDWSEVAEEYLELMKYPKRIGVVNDDLAGGFGVTRVAVELAKQFADNADEVFFYKLDGDCDEDLEKELQEKNITVREITRGEGFRKITGLKTVAKEFEEDNLDYLNTHDHYLPIAAAFSSIPTIKTYHAQITAWSEISNQKLHWLQTTISEALPIWKAEHRVSISKYAAKQMKMYYGVNSEVIYNGIDTDRFREMETDYRARNDIPEDKVVVGTLSALREYKNQQETLDYYAENYSDKDSLLLIGGDGETKERLQKKAEELDINEETIFKGFIPEEDLVDFYNALDVFVYLSKWEGFGLPPIEALLCGCETKVKSEKALEELTSIEGISKLK